MFGIKILKESAYRSLVFDADKCSELMAKCAMLKRDNEDLRGMINDNLMSKKRGGYNQDEMKHLKDLHVIRAENYPCANCQLNNDSCKKLIFANTTVCVSDKALADIINNDKKKKK